jgi:hypothetical protein
MPQVGMQKSKRLKEARSFFVTDGKCLSWNFQFSAVRRCSGGAV